jgi:hypothetical protein
MSFDTYAIRGPKFSPALLPPGENGLTRIPERGILRWQQRLEALT